MESGDNDSAVDAYATTNLDNLMQTTNSPYAVTRFVFFYYEKYLEQIQSS